MKARQVVIDIMKKQGIANATMAHRLNISLATAWDMTSSRTRTNEMTTKMLVPTLNALDYKLITVPRDAKLPADSYVID